MRVHKALVVNELHGTREKSLYRLSFPIKHVVR